MKTASLPGVTHSLKSTMWPTLLRLAASPGWSAVQSMVVDCAVENGANSSVTRPGAGRPHAHDTRPEQSERYGSHAALLVRLHTAAHDGSASACPFSLWQYCSFALTHCSAAAIVAERVTLPAGTVPHAPPLLPPLPPPLLLPLLPPLPPLLPLPPPLLPPLLPLELPELPPPLLP